MSDLDIKEVKDTLFKQDIITNKVKIDDVIDIIERYLATNDTFTYKMYRTSFNKDLDYYDNPYKFMKIIPILLDDCIKNSQSIKLSQQETQFIDMYHKTLRSYIDMIEVFKISVDPKPFYSYLLGFVLNKLKLEINKNG